MFYDPFLLLGVAKMSPVTHYVKSVRIWSFSIPYFPTFGLNTERHGVFQITSKQDILPW